MTGAVGGGAVVGVDDDDVVDAEPNSATPLCALTGGSSVIVNGAIGLSTVPPLQRGGDPGAPWYELLREPRSRPRSRSDRSPPPRQRGIRESPGRPRARCRSPGFPGPLRLPVEVRCHGSRRPNPSRRPDGAPRATRPPSYVIVGASAFRSHRCRRDRPDGHHRGRGDAEPPSLLVGRRLVPDGSLPRSTANASPGSRRNVYQSPRPRISVGSRSAARRPRLHDDLMWGSVGWRSTTHPTENRLRENACLVHEGDGSSWLREQRCSHQRSRYRRRRRNSPTLPTSSGNIAGRQRFFDRRRRRRRQTRIRRLRCRRCPRRGP